MPSDTRSRDVLGAAITDYRKIFAAYDAIRAGLTRMGFLLAAVLGIGIGGAVAWVLRDVPAVVWRNGWPSFGWFIIVPTITWRDDDFSLWLFEAVFFIAGVVFFFQGVAALFEAFRFTLAPKSSGVHGAARPADEAEAQAAARGEASAQNLRDKQFRD